VVDQVLLLGARRPVVHPDAGNGFVVVGAGLAAGARVPVPGVVVGVRAFAVEDVPDVVAVSWVQEAVLLFGIIALGTGVAALLLWFMRVTR
jgi:hypothetical protein